ncbi:hypothetical protein [Sinosporangium album]|uniref:hypothetical protein n=1 Tax=Sinosporangium album TaxID=504805 RepID=UPI001FDEAD3D|nr:hypothetical protein [Sinosporangium album]
MTARADAKRADTAVLAETAEVASRGAERGAAFPARGRVMASGGHTVRVIKESARLSGVMSATAENGATIVRAGPAVVTPALETTVGLVGIVRSGIRAIVIPVIVIRVVVSVVVIVRSGRVIGIAVAGSVIVRVMAIRGGRVVRIGIGLVGTGRTATATPRESGPIVIGTPVAIGRTARVSVRRSVVPAEAIEAMAALRGAETGLIGPMIAEVGAAIVPIGIVIRSVAGAPSVPTTEARGPIVRATVLLTAVHVVVTVRAVSRTEDTNAVAIVLTGAGAIATGGASVTGAIVRIAPMIVGIVRSVIRAIVIRAIVIRAIVIRAIVIPVIVIPVIVIPVIVIRVVVSVVAIVRSGRVIGIAVAGSVIVRVMAIRGGRVVRIGIGLVGTGRTATATPRESGPIVIGTPVAIGRTARVTATVGRSGRSRAVRGAGMASRSVRRNVRMPLASGCPSLSPTSPRTNSTARCSTGCVPFRWSLRNWWLSTWSRRNGLFPATTSKPRTSMPRSHVVSRPASGSSARFRASRHIGRGSTPRL